MQKKYEEQNIPFKIVEKGFSYNSGSNERFLNIEEIRKLIRENIDPQFEPK